MNSLLKGRTSKNEAPKRSFFSRMKEKAAVLALVAAASCGTKTGLSHEPASPVADVREDRDSGTDAGPPVPSGPCSLPTGSAPFDFGPSPGPVPPERCDIFPQIDEWAGRRCIDRHLVRAFVMTESGFNEGAATKVCSRNAISSGATPGCFPAGPDGNSEGYLMGYDEMYDPSGRFSFDNAPDSGSSMPSWRWLALGLMQTLEPPFTFWPAAYHPEGVDGDYHDIFARSRLYGMPLDAARECNPNFNPFNPGDSVCLGTVRMEAMMRQARAWINSNRALLGWSPMDTARDEIFAAYITGNMYHGLWSSRERASDHPRCSSSMTNGDCWAFGFAQSRSVDMAYCQSTDGRADSARCESGHPKVGPDPARPVDCYGMMDFVQYVRNCELPYLPRPADPGAVKMRIFYTIRNSCP